MRKTTFSVVLLLTMFQISRVLVSAQDKPAAPISGICGIVLGDRLPLGEYQKKFRWQIRLSVRVFESDDATYRKVIATPEVESSGYFRVNLPPGKYKIVPQSDWNARPAPPSAEWQTVVVETSKFSVVTIDYS